MCTFQEQDDQLAGPPCLCCFFSFLLFSGLSTLLLFLSVSACISMDLNLLWFFFFFFSLFFSVAKLSRLGWSPCYLCTYLYRRRNEL
ncbi:hypothetical protein I7I53_10971 [Histoplasma capsulatum var. duboisii H88]|uniref:Uncharacterized protein n=1 Tax=Ajellomyces capsulatus (strain H88) TaxID=544711 RepID=A0A8A1LCZ0_AJEC8|nr:hypothetical protein I7I53_10971 [Histoplasma capsulatum var. duboisii H88]